MSNLRSIGQIPPTIAIYVVLKTLEDNRVLKNYFIIQIKLLQLVYFAKKKKKRRNLWYLFSVSSVSALILFIGFLLVRHIFYFVVNVQFSVHSAKTSPLRIFMILMRPEIKITLILLL